MAPRCTCRGMAAPDRHQRRNLRSAASAPARGGRAHPPPWPARVASRPGKDCRTIRPGHCLAGAAGQAGGRDRPSPLPRIQQPRDRNRAWSAGEDCCLPPGRCQEPAQPQPGRHSSNEKWVTWPRSALFLSVNAEFDRELARELHRILDPISASPVPPWRTPAASSNPARKVLGGAGAALGVKAMTGFAIAAMAATAAAGAASEVAITGSFNPADWGHQARHQVTGVSSQHGAAPGEQQAPSSAPANVANNSSVSASAPASGTPANGTPSKNVTPDNGPDKGKVPVAAAGVEPEPTDPGMHHGPMPVGPTIP